jgi:methionyl-tRNA formyltransferase
VRTVYLGTSEFAATVLRALAGSPHRPALVVTPPDRPQGRGRKLQSPPAADAARELEIDLLQAKSVNDPEALERIDALGAEGAAVCAFGQLIKEPLLSRWEILNVHPSLLPRWRGAAPIERALMAGDERTGVSVMKLTEGLDSGPVAAVEEIAIGPEEYYDALASRLATLGGEMLVEAFDRQGAGELALVEQDDSRASYAEKIDGAERRLDPGRAAEELARQVRALTPHIGAYLETADGKRLGVRRARPVDAETDVDVAAGELRAERGALLLGCARGALRLEVVQPAGGKPMAAESFLRGNELPRL